MADELAALKPVVLKKALNAEGKPDGVHFAYEYVKPKTAGLEPFYKLAHDGDLLHHLPEIQAIDGMLMLPRPITFVMAECREPNAFYSSDRAEVVMCYETMQVLLDRGQQLAKDQELGDDYAQKYLAANLRFVLLHETGHALIDLLEIPVTGREEDAVDQLATTLMQRFAGVNESPRQVSREPAHGVQLVPGAQHRPVQPRRLCRRARARRTALLQPAVPDLRQQSGALHRASSPRATCRRRGRRPARPRRAASAGRGCACCFHTWRRSSR